MKYETYHDNPLSTLLGGSFFILVIGLLVFGASGQDDPYITYAVAQGLAEHNTLTNINGDAVEQGSSILHVVLLALAAKLSTFLAAYFPSSLPFALPFALPFTLPLPLPVLGIICSLFFALLCLPLTYRLAQRLDIYRPSIPVYLLAFSTAFTYWAMGGLESTLASFIVLYGVFALADFIEEPQSVKRYGHLFLSITLFLLTRPEAFFVLMATAVIASAFLWRQHVSEAVKEPRSPGSFLPRILVILLCATVAFTAIALLRLHFFGQIFPQPVYAKAGGFGLEKIAHGLLYFLMSAQISLIIYTLVLFIPIRHWYKKQPCQNTTLIVTVSFALAYLAFIITSGGDWMGGGRFFVPILPLLVCVFCYFLEPVKYFTLTLSAFFLLLAVELAGFAELQATGMPVYHSAQFKASLKNTPDWNGYSWAETSNYVHANDIALLEALRPIVRAMAYERPVTISGVQMGMIPYFLRSEFNERVQFVDMRGLTTRHITDCSDFADAPKLWTGIFVDYPHYFAAQETGHCHLPAIDIIYELQNLNEHDNAARLEALQQHGYHIVYRQNTLITGGYFGKKELDIPYIVAVNDAVYLALPERLRYVEKPFTNKPDWQAELHTP